LNRPTIQYDDKLVPISQIDTTDSTYCLSLHTDPTGLVAAIQAVGIINPPVLIQKDNGVYGIVCGFRRIGACRSLGWTEIHGRVLAENLSEFQLFKLAILDNRSHGPLNVVEQAQGVQKLSPYIPAKNRLEVLSSLLGFPTNRKVYSKISALGRLPEVMLVGLLQGTLSFEAAFDLSRLPPDEATACFDVLARLKLSQNKQREIIRLTQEIAKREHHQSARVLQCADVKAILDSHDLNRNEKGAMLRAYLKRRRFPTLVKAEEKFLKQVKALKLNEYVHITPPPYFEGDSYTLRMTFKNLEDFEKGRDILNAMAKNPALKRLLNPY
jgi:hypothetical protein